MELFVFLGVHSGFTFSKLGFLCNYNCIFFIFFNSSSTSLSLNTLSVLPVIFSFCSSLCVSIGFSVSHLQLSFETSIYHYLWYWLLLASHVFLFWFYFFVFWVIWQKASWQRAHGKWSFDYLKNVFILSHTWWIVWLGILFSTDIILSWDFASMTLLSPNF
jgi:hypothetical protein